MIINDMLKELENRGWACEAWFDPDNVRLVVWSKDDFMQFFGDTYTEALEKAVAEITSEEETEIEQ